ncbi:hypothetical protein [Marinoscillum pacificum]|uniref:hypothetical protein n=1 Tax=Marinoscillum pacificum TaxID=392723 RepID=UPI0021584059|nr:hypothetical protein [Marinoscillum pacificum]
MKKAILTMAVVALVCSTAMSKTDPSDKASSNKISLTKTDNSKFSLDMVTNEKGVVRLKIIDEKGKLLVAEKVSFNKSFSLPIDMSNMSEGNYTVKAESSISSLEQSVFVSTLHEEDVAAFLRNEGNRNFRLKVYHENIPVSIKIIDAAGHVYYDKTITSEINFIQNFDLSQISESVDLEMIISGKKSTIYKSI